MRNISLAFFVFLLTCCTKTEQPKEQVEFVAIATLLKNPAIYDGKLVRIHGAAVVRFEGNFVCSDAAMIDAGDSTKCLWLSNEALNLSPFHGKVVELIGTFNSKHHGHMGAYGGAIAPIKGKVLGAHGRGSIPGPPPPPPMSSANYAIKGTSV